MIEYDLVMMSLCIFIPTIFALALLFFPKGTEEYMRWTALTGTAVTFVISSWVFIDYLNLLETHTDNNMTRKGIKRAGKDSTLQNRAEKAAADAGKNKLLD